MYDIYADKTFPFDLVREENEMVRLSWILDHDRVYSRNPSQCAYGIEISKFINLYIDALCENDTEKAQYYFGLIKRY